MPFSSITDLPGAFICSLLLSLFCCSHPCTWQHQLQPQGRHTLAHFLLTWGEKSFCAKWKKRKEKGRWSCTMMLGGGWKKREKKWTYVICDWFQRVEGLLLLNMEGLNEAGLWIEKVEAWSPLSLFFLFLSFSFSLFPPPPVLCPPIQIKGVKKNSKWAYWCCT